jgi:ADP-heptose:LPS heptosyltransferase
MKRIEPGDPRLPPLRRFDARVDRIAAWLWGRKPRRHVLIVFMLGRGDLALFSHVFDRFRPLLGPGERFDMIVRPEVAELAFIMPEGVRIRGLPIRRFFSNRLTRLVWSLRIARRRYRRALLFDTNWTALRDDRIARLGAGEEVDIVVPFPENLPSAESGLRSFPPERYHLNRDRLHMLDLWTEFAAALGGADGPPPVPRFDPVRLPPPQRGARPHVLLHPFPSFASKFFRPAVYEPLVEALADTHDVIVSTGPRDLKPYKRMRRLARFGHVRFERRSLRDVVGLVRGADLVVTVDTVTGHLGIGCGVPTLVLHNDEDRDVYMPYPRPAEIPHARFLAVPHDPAIPRPKRRPRRIWEAASEVPETVREAALGMLRESGRRAG